MGIRSDMRRATSNVVDLAERTSAEVRNAGAAVTLAAASLVVMAVAVCIGVVIYAVRR